MGTGTQGWRSFLDLLATVLVIVASVCAVALTASTWLRGRHTPQEGTVSGASSSQHSLKGAQILGDRQAKVALIEYADFECSFCAQFAQQTWPELKKRFVDTGQVLVAFRHLPLPSHQYAKGAAVGAVCAGEQGRFWDMHDRLFQRQGTLDESSGPSLARELGLDLGKYDECARRAAGEVEREAAVARSLGVNGTPSLALGRVLGEDKVTVAHFIVGAQPIEFIAPLIDGLLASTN